MQEINKWLTGSREFEQGAKLYQKHGDNGFFKLLLKDGATPYNIERLAAELEKLAPPPPAEEPENIKEEKPEINLADVELKLQIEAEIKTTYRQLDFNRAILTQSDKKEILHETAKQILKLRKKLNEYWFLIDYFEDNGHFPKQKVGKKYTQKEAIQYLWQSNSKAKKRLQNPDITPEQRERTEKLIADNNAKIKELGGKVK